MRSRQTHEAGGAWSKHSPAPWQERYAEERESARRARNRAVAAIWSVFILAGIDAGLLFVILSR